MLHLSILDDERQAILPLFVSFKDDGFYLAGGTGLALQIGHRDSIDFDFFKEGDFETGMLAEKIQEVFTGHSIIFTQNEKNTLSCVIDENVQLSFFGFRYPLLKPLVANEYFDIASVADIGCMKLAAITSRSVQKDYIDLYFILQLIPLVDLIDLSRTKYPTLDSTLVLKSLVYFDDVLQEQILFKEGNNISFEVVKDFLQNEGVKYFKK